MLLREMAWCFFLGYWTILAAELIGDRSIYTVTSLAMRFRPVLVYCGIVLAFSGKMLVAVLCGSLLLRLSPVWIGAISAATFFATAICVWLKKFDETEGSVAATPGWSNAVVLSFSAVFFSEWADFGQISAAALAAKYNAPGPIWLGGSLALCTKGALAITVGLNLRRRIPRRVVRSLSVASCLALGFTALFDLLRH